MSKKYLYWKTELIRKDAQFKPLIELVNSLQEKFDENVIMGYCHDIDGAPPKLEVKKVKDSARFKCVVETKEK